MVDEGQYIKVVVLGKEEVGKTSIVNRFVNDEFDKDLGRTFGGTFSMKKLQYKGNTAHFKIWDTAGQEKFRCLGKMYYQDAAVCLLVYDVTQEKSLEDLKYWANELKQNGPEVSCVVGNKIDITDKEQISITLADKFAQSIGANFYQVSALDGTGIKDLFEDIASKFVSGVDESVFRDRKTTIDISNSSQVKKNCDNKGGCNC